MLVYYRSKQRTRSDHKQLTRGSDHPKYLPQLTPFPPVKKCWCITRANRERRAIISSLPGPSQISPSVNSLPSCKKCPDLPSSNSLFSFGLALTVCVLHALAVHGA